MRAPRISMLLFRVVDRVARDLDHQVLLGHDGLAAQARVGLQAPGAVEQVFFALVHLVERVEALAHDHVAGGAGATHLASMLDRDVVLEQRLADRRARRDLNGAPFGAVLVVGQDLDGGHSAHTSSTLRPAKAWRMPRFMRSAANASVPFASASTAASIARWSLPAATLPNASIRRSISPRSSGRSKSPSATSAERVASVIRSASTRDSRSARSCMSPSAARKPSCS